MSNKLLRSNQVKLKPPNHSKIRRNPKKSPELNNTALVNSNFIIKGLISCDRSDGIFSNLLYIFWLSNTQSFMNYQLDQQLKQLVNRAQKLDKTSIERRKIIDYLIRLIQKSPQLKNLERTYHNDIDIFAEGVHQAYISLNKSLEKYEILEEASFMAWFLTVVRNKIRDIFRSRQKRQQNETSLVINNSDEKEIERELPAPETGNSMSPSEKIREIITVDPDIILQKNLSTKYRDWRHKIHPKFFILMLDINVACFGYDVYFLAIAKLLNDEYSRLFSFYFQILNQQRSFFHLIGYFCLYQSLIITPSKILRLRFEVKSGKEIALEFGVKTKNPAQTAYRWIDYFEKSESRKAELNEYIDKYLSDWEEIRSEYL